MPNSGAVNHAAQIKRISDELMLHVVCQLQGDLNRVGGTLCQHLFWHWWGSFLACKLWRDLPDSPATLTASSDHECILLPASCVNLSWCGNDLLLLLLLASVTGPEEG